MVWYTTGFNRYMVECEFLWSCRYNQRISVLIDTWWNVNKTLDDIYVLLHWVLIDTWWNVNDLYIHLTTFIYLVLIDTWWNVNIRQQTR